jgi:hypothetical protein
MERVTTSRGKQRRVWMRAWRGRRRRARTGVQKSEVSDAIAGESLLVARGRLTTGKSRWRDQDLPNAIKSSRSQASGPREALHGGLLRSACCGSGSAAVSNSSPPVQTQTASCVLPVAVAAVDADRRGSWQRSAAQRSSS